MGKKFKQIIKLLSIATLTCVLLFGAMTITAQASSGKWNNAKENHSWESDWWKWWTQAQSGDGNIVQSGCRIVSLTKLLVDVGAITDPENFTPDDFFKWGLKKGKFDSGYNETTYVGGSAEAFAQEHGVELKRDRTEVKINTKTTEGLESAKTTISDYLNRGYYILIGYDGHQVYVDRARSSGTNIYVATTGNKEGVCRLEECNNETSVNQCH